MLSEKPLVVIHWKLAYLMVDKEIGTTKLAEMTGLHPTTISKLKRRREMPERLDKRTFEELCHALQCQPGDLLTLG